jgi:spermidine synthase
MAVSLRDLKNDPVPAVAAQALLLGLSLAGLAFAGSSVLLLQARGLLGATVGVFATLLATLGAGAWVAAPLEADEAPPLRARWMTAGLGFGLAGVFATAFNALSHLVPPMPARVITLLVLIAVPSYVLGALVPTLAAWAERRDEGREARGWGLLGWMFGGVLAGLVAGMLVIGLLLLPRVGAGPVLLALGAALLLPTLFPEPPAAESDEETLYDADTPFGSIRVLEVVYPGERQPERRLLLNDEEESGELVRSGAPTLAYIAAAERWLGETTPAAARYLFLGGGAYTLPRRIAERDGRADIEVVELDPEVTRVAYRYFGVRREHGIATFHADARAFAERAAPGAYDRIYLDVYSGGEALPYSLTTVEAFEALRRLLRPGGWLAMNTIGVVQGAESPRLWSIVRTLDEVFPTVGMYVHLGRDDPDRQNVLLVASADAAAAIPERAGLFEPWPRAEWPGARTTTVFRDVFTAGPRTESGQAEPGPQVGLGRSARSAP